jgi:hypothetical protein
MQLAPNHQADKAIGSKLADFLGSDFMPVSEYRHALG